MKKVIFYILVFLLIPIPILGAVVHQKGTTIPITNKVIIHPTLIGSEELVPYKEGNCKQCIKLQNDNGTPYYLAWGNNSYYYYGARLIPLVNNGHSEFIFCKLEYILATCQTQTPVSYKCTTWVYSDNNGNIGQRVLGYCFNMPQIPPGEAWIISLDIESYNVSYPNEPFWLLAGSNITNGNLYAPLTCLDNDGAVGLRNIYWASGGWQGIYYGDVMDRAWIKYTGVDVEEAEENKETIELRVYPNPFSKKVIIQYSMHRSETGNVKLRIYDLSGREIKGFYDLALKGRILWDGRDELDKKITPGIYFLSLQGVASKITRKVSLLY